VFESIVHDLSELQRVLLGQAATPSVVVLEGRTLQSTPESGHRAGWDGAKRRKGSKAHIAVDTLGQLLSVVITPANEQERTQVGELCRQVQEITGQTVTVGFVDQGYTGEEAEYAAVVYNIDLQVVKKPEGQTGFVLLPKRWVVERSFAWLSRFRRLGRDYERLSVSLQQLYFVVFACLMLARYITSS
jgi:transposase